MNVINCRMAPSLLWACFTFLAYTRIGINPHVGLVSGDYRLLLG
jgi:hypothetical protein